MIWKGCNNSGPSQPPSCPPRASLGAGWGRQGAPQRRGWDRAGRPGAAPAPACGARSRGAPCPSPTGPGAARTPGGAPTSGRGSPGPGGLEEEEAAWVERGRRAAPPRSASSFPLLPLSSSAF